MRIESAVTGDTIVFGSASPSADWQETREETVARPRAADDFAAIRERMEELRRERVQQVRGEAAADKRETVEKGSGRPPGRPDLGPLSRGRPFLR